MKFDIRSAQPQDLPQIVQLCADHAAYEQCDYVSEGKLELLRVAIFGDSPKLYCIVAEVEGAVVGYATFMLQFSTWDASEYIYMDCLYLDEGCRGHRIGEQLIDEIKIFGKSRGIDHVQWQTPDFNVRAIKFYKRIGASSKSKERFFLPIR